MNGYADSNLSVDSCLGQQDVLSTKENFPRLSPFFRDGFGRDYLLSSVMVSAPRLSPFFRDGCGGDLQYSVMVEAIVMPNVTMWQMCGSGYCSCSLTQDRNAVAIRPQAIDYLNPTNDSTLDRVTDNTLISLIP